MVTISTLGKDRDFLKLRNAYKTNIQRDSSKENDYFDYHYFVNNNSCIQSIDKMNKSGLHISLLGINSKTYISKQPMHEWLSINNIPSCIFMSVWEFIESNNCHLHPKKPMYKIVDHEVCKTYHA
jgi:hypothetical protein